MSGSVPVVVEHMDYKSIFAARLSGKLEQLRGESQATREMLRMVASDKARQGHYNRIGESVTRMQDVVKGLERIDLHDELIAEAARKQVEAIVRRAVLFAQEDARYGAR